MGMVYTTDVTLLRMFRVQYHGYYASPGNNLRKLERHL